MPRITHLASIIVPWMAFAAFAHAQARTPAVKADLPAGSTVSGHDRSWTLKTLLPARKPAFGMKKILVVAERRLAENAELRQRFERYAEDIWRAYGAGVKLISLESDSPRYLKGLIRREMSAGGPGMNAVALEALLPDRRVAHAERRLSTGEAGGALHWGAVFFKAEPPAWKKAEIALRKAGSDFMHHVSTQAAFVSTGHSGERKV